MKMVDHIVDEHHIEIDPEMLKRVKVDRCCHDITFFNFCYDFVKLLIMFVNS